MDKTRGFRKSDKNSKTWQADILKYNIKMTTFTWQTNARTLSTENHTQTIQ